MRRICRPRSARRRSHQGRGTGRGAEATSTTVRVAKQTPSRIVIKNTWAGVSHPVTRAEDGQQVADINGAVGREDVPPGLYNVSFPNGVWRGVEVKPGETTELEVGLLKIEGGPSDIWGYVITDPETDEVVTRRGVISSLPLMPGRFNIALGEIGWQNVEITPAAPPSSTPPASPSAATPRPSTASPPPTAARPEKSQYCSACRSRRAATSWMSKGRR